MIESTGGIIAARIQYLASNVRKNADDEEKDGILYCGRCREPKQAWIDWIPDKDGNTRKMLVPVCCRCEREQDERDAAEERRRQFKINLRQMRERYGLQPPGIERYRFADDDSAASPISRTMREYVAKWDKMRASNIGVLLYGEKGVGKSYYAGCVVNALAEQMVPTLFTTTAQVMSAMQSSWERSEIVGSINEFRLVVLDDFGAERDTPFGSEIMYQIIDSRYRAKLPTIVTTNLDIADLQNENDMWRGRLYDRVMEMCPIAISMTGTSRRIGLADERKRMAREFLRNAAGAKGSADGD